MKIQELGIIFIIIILPISIVLSKYTQYQIQTINNQTSYDTKLTEATFDAIKAFQINTANSTTSNITSSKLRDIEASVQTFKNSLITSFKLNGYNADDMNNFIPALVFTMYDGFYIYSAYKQNVNDQGGQITNGASEYGLKPYIPYSCRYNNGSNIDVVITYTLDNYITVQGTIDGNYVNKSGYLIDGIKVIGETVTYNGVEINNEYNLKEKVCYVTIEENPDPAAVKPFIVNYNKKGELPYVKYNGTKYYYDENYINVDNEGNPIKDEDGNIVKGRIFQYTNGECVTYASNTADNVRFLEIDKANGHDGQDILGSSYTENFDGNEDVTFYDDPIWLSSKINFKYNIYEGKHYYFNEIDNGNNYKYFYVDDGKEIPTLGNKKYNEMLKAIKNNNAAKIYYKKACDFRQFLIDNSLTTLTWADAYEVSYNQTDKKADLQPIWGPKDDDEEEIKQQKRNLYR